MNAKKRTTAMNQMVSAVVRFFAENLIQYLDLTPPGKIYETEFI